MTQQLAFDFGIDHNSPSFKQGFAVGVNWDSNWMPGGPWVYTTHNKPFVTPKLLKMAEDSKRHHDEWMRGFKYGLDRLLECDERFRNWWVNYNGKGHQRYIQPSIWF